MARPYMEFKLAAVLHSECPASNNQATMVGVRNVSLMANSHFLAELRNKRLTHVDYSPICAFAAAAR
ncbi:hypothetical protein AEGHOMDF_0798 [Methylobacterium soli]|nr:hypothetical protein AEGHOMDF_0798 [Methylobacterium soli]